MLCVVVVLVCLFACVLVMLICRPLLSCSYHLAFPYISPRRSSPILSLDDVSLYLYQLIITLRYTHAHNIIHRNVKRANIMVDDMGHLVLIDFEHSAVYQHKVKYELIGNPHCE